MKRFVIILTSVVISLASISYGAYWLGNTAYQDGINTGIDTVINECAKHTEKPLVFYNGKTGSVMVCGGDTLTQPQEAPENDHSEPPSPTPGQPEPQKHKRSFEDQPPPTNI